ncbi:MAG: sugar kinase [Desulfobacteraceae bacterium]|nr:sugar kinase [Desulfobacteraceae bacterium]
MCEIWTMGEMLVEIMRPKAGMALFAPGEFVGPFPSGAPAIFIDTVARLNHGAGIMGGVGKDDFGKNILDRLKKDGVNTDYVFESEDESTAVAFVTYFDDGSRKFIFHIGNTPAVKVKDFDIKDIKSPKFFHIMGCSLMVSEVFRKRIIKTAISFAQTGAKISFDPNIRTELLGDRTVDELLGDVMDNCSVILPGIEELRMITGMDGIDDGINKLFEYGNMEIVALKKGSQGCTVYSRSQKIDCAPNKVDAVDPTGAGDCFDAAFLCGLLDDKSLRDCARMASAAGALNTLKLGPMEGDISIENLNKLTGVE